MDFYRDQTLGIKNTLRPPPSEEKEEPNGSIFRKRIVGELFTAEEARDGRREAVREEIKEREKAKEKLNQLLDRSNDVLYELSSVFPFDFFPDKIIIDTSKVTIIANMFFFSGEVHTVLIKNVRDVVVEMSILFATLKMTVFDYKTDSIKICYLKRSEAMKARRIILGLMAISKEGVDLSKLTKEDAVVDKIEKLGMSQDT